MKMPKLAMKPTLLLAIGSLLFVGCSKPSEPSPEDAAPEKAVKVEEVAEPVEEEEIEGPELSPEEPETKLGELPVPADLEEEADRTIVADNLESELDRIEAEIDG